MPHDIFISYSRRNLAAVKTIKEELESLGFSCWMDLEGIESGLEEFSEHLARAIKPKVRFYQLNVKNHKREPVDITIAA